jgi:very-short-patch-repair endonuclease
MDYATWMAVARRQEGLIHRRQLHALGVTDRQIHRLVGQGCLRKLDHGVLRVSGAPATRLATLWQPVLATRGVLVSGSAAFLWGMLREPPAVVQIAVRPGRRLTPPPGCQLRRVELTRGELTRRYGLPLTGQIRSALDLLAALDIVEATTFADRAISQGWLTIADLQHRLAAPLPGNVQLRKLIRTLAGGAEAESERRLHRLLRAHRITGWTANHPVLIGGTMIARLDIAFVEARLAIEVDGFAYHRDRDRFQRDRTRQNALVNLGWTVLRFTWQDITAKPDQVIATVRLALSRAA